MAALGELINLIIFIVLAAVAIVLLFLTFRANRWHRPWLLGGSLFFCCLFVGYRLHLNNIHKKDQLQQVGIYYLNNYPGCDSCVIELKDDMTYQVRSKGSVIEKNNWHYESGGDFWITYLDNGKNQLGSGKYAYEHYELRSGQGK